MNNLSTLAVETIRGKRVLSVQSFQSVQAILSAGSGQDGRFAVVSCNVFVFVMTDGIYCVDVGSVLKREEHYYDWSMMYKIVCKTDRVDSIVSFTEVPRHAVFLSVCLFVFVTDYVLRLALGIG